MWKFPKIVILSPELVEEMKKLKFTEFAKFDDPKHPLYEEYKDRHFEKWHDEGFNNGIDAVVRMILEKLK